MDLSLFNKLPILGILRGITSDSIEPLTETAVSSGLYAIEITMNTPDAPGLISQMAKTADGRLAVGAGTVLTMDDLRSALDAGATFIVMPALIADVMDYCVKNSIPVFPGALTPQEIYNAWNAGATMVKVFPDPVTPSSTCALSPLIMPSLSCSMASGWSPVGLKSDVSLNFKDVSFESKNTLKKKIRVEQNTVSPFSDAGVDAGLNARLVQLTKGDLDNLSAGLLFNHDCDLIKRSIRLGDP